MPYTTSGQSSLYYETYGSGFPLLALAPGGMDSNIDAWPRASIDPVATLADQFQVVAMDQRNTGRSSGPLDADDPWGAYAADQLAVLDHLGVDRLLVMGCCIGGPFVLKLIEQAPDRIVAAVLQQPVGIIPSNRQFFDEMWKSWAARLASSSRFDPSELATFASALWARDAFVSVPAEFVATIATPLLVLPGIDEPHPTEIGHLIAGKAPNASLLEPWKDPAHVDGARIAVREWLVAQL